MNTNVTNNKFVNEWIAEMAEMVKPSNIVLIDGSNEQAELLRAEAIKGGELIKLNEEKYPNCYLHEDAAFVEPGAVKVLWREFPCEDGLFHCEQSAALVIGLSCADCARLCRQSQSQTHCAQDHK